MVGGMAMNENKRPQVYMTNDTEQTFNDPFANMNMEKDQLKGQKKKNIIIIIFVIVVFFLLMYIFLDSVNDKKEKKEVIPEVKENLDDVSLELTDFIDEYQIDAMDAYGVNDLLMVGINYVCYGVEGCKVISASVVSDYIKNVFGKDAEFKDVQCSLNDGVLYSYTDGKFIYNDAHPAHDLPNTKPIYSKVSSIKKKNDKYILVLNKLYYSDKSEYITSDALGINKIYNYSDYDMPSDSGSVIDMTKLVSDYNNDFDRLQNKGNKYQYTFSKNDKGFVLEKYEVIDLNK